MKPKTKVPRPRGAVTRPKTHAKTTTGKTMLGGESTPREGLLGIGVYRLDLLSD